MLMYTLPSVTVSLTLWNTANACLAFDTLVLASSDPPGVSVNASSAIAIAKPCAANEHSGSNASAWLKYSVERR